MTFDRRHVAQGLAAGALSLGLPSARAQTPASQDELIAAAKREGKVVVYSAYVSPTTNDPIAKAFEAKYGIKVETFTARGPELRERVRVEQMTGRLLGDVQHNAMTQVAFMIKELKNLEPLGTLPSLDRLKPEFKERVDEFEVPIFTINYGLLLGSGVKAGEEPKSWQDLTDPKWKGRILCDDPRASGGGRVWFHMTMDKFGQSYHDKMATQGLVFSRDYGEAARRVARGEFAIYIPFIFSQLAPLKGLPVKVVVPEEGVTYGSYSVSIFKGAQHPNAAKLLADFYLSDEVQGIYANTGHGVVIKDLKASVSPDMQPFANVKPLVAEDFTRIEQYLALAKQIYK